MWDEAWPSRVSVHLIGRKELEKLFKLRMKHMNNGPEMARYMSCPMWQFVDQLFR